MLAGAQLALNVCIMLGRIKHQIEQSARQNELEHGNGAGSRRRRQRAKQATQASSDLSRLSGRKRISYYASCPLPKCLRSARRNNSSRPRLT